jgi:Mrp family chromosome partitioning ATPase
LKALSRKYGSKHPRILEQQVVLEGIVEHIYRRAEAIRERLKNAWLAAEENEADAMQALEEAKKRVHEFEATATEYRRHEMEVETNKKMYEALLSRRMESVVETGATRAPTEWEQGTSNIRVIDRAVAPGSPFRPRPLVNMSLAVFVGLALGCGTAFFVVYLDDKVRTPDDVTEDLGKSLLAEIPFARERSATERSRSLVTYEHPDRAVSEAYRNLRTNVQLLGRDGNFPSVLVTSACHGEGKTTTAVNLAITIAQAGRKVLIVDTDMRRPRMHRHFGIDESVGLIRYFSGEASLEDVMVDKSELVNPRQPRERPDTPAGVQEVRRAGRLEQGELWVLPCGERRVSNPTEVIGSRMMQELMADLRKRFDVVIFDSPPCNFSDPLILAKMVNGVLVVVEAGKFGKSLIMQGLDNLDRVEGGKVFGVILNKYDPKKSATYGYYGYRSYYYTYDRYHHSRRGQGFWHRLLYRSPADKGARATRKRHGSSPGGDAVA